MIKYLINNEEAEEKEFYDELDNTIYIATDDTAFSEYIDREYAPREGWIVFNISIYPSEVLYKEHYDVYSEQKELWEKELQEEWYDELDNKGYVEIEGTEFEIVEE